MRNICKLVGRILLGFSALITIIGPTSIAQIAVEKMPESMKSKR